MTKKKAALDDGHGGRDKDGKPLTPGKRSPDGMLENEFNSPVVAYAKAELERCGIEVVLTAPGEKDHSLHERCETANQAGVDVFVSVHANAITGVMGKWGGIETYHNVGSKEGKKLAEAIHKEVLGGTPLIDRGVKEAPFYVLKHTIAPAVLCELGFMDSLHDLPLLKLDAYRRECAIEIAKGVCKYLEVPYVPEKPKEPVKTATASKNKVFYRAVAGSFQERSAVEKRIEELKEKGFVAFIDIYEK